MIDLVIDFLKDNAVLLGALAALVAIITFLAQSFSLPIKKLSPESGQPKSVTTESSETIASRLRFMSTITDAIRGDPSNFRLMSVGPLCLNPDWVVERRDANSSFPNFESELYGYIIRNSKERNSNIRIIFRNADRYRDKIDLLIDDSERDRFIKDTLEKIDTVWGKGLERGPDLMCGNVGHFFVEAIFDEFAVTTSRPNESTPISGGKVFRDTRLIAEERDRFDTYFDANYRGQAAEITALRGFVENLWKTQP